MSATMTKRTPKKSERRKKRDDERPLELGREWADLEAQHDRSQIDWMGLAAQIGLGGDKD